MEDAVAKRCIEMIAETKDIPESSISMDSTLESLGLDSLDKINLGFNMEEAFNVVIPDDRLKEIRTVGDIVTGVHTLQAEKAGATPQPEKPE